MADPQDDLKCTIETLGPVSRELDVEVSAAEAARVHEEMAASFASRAKLPGFRPGKAPLDVVLQKFGPDIEHEVIDQLIPESLHRVLEKNAIRAVGIPSVRDVSYRAGEPIRYTAVVETWPEFDLPPYKKLKLKKRDESVSDEDVAKTIEDLRLKHAEHLPVENRGIQAGDFVILQIQGRDLKTKRLMPVEKISVVAGHEGNDPAVEAHLSGLRTGEETVFEHAYPADDPRNSAHAAASPSQACPTVCARRGGGARIPSTIKARRNSFNPGIHLETDSVFRSMGKVTAGSPPARRAPVPAAFQRR